MTMREAVAVPPGLPEVTSGEPQARRFQGQDCLVTGAASGIGRATALRLAAEGGRIIAGDTDLSAASETIALSGRSDGIAVTLDVRSSESVASLAGLIEQQCGGLDVLVNNAGIEILGTIDETAPEIWDEVMAVNLRGPYLVSRMLMPLMKRRATMRGGAAIVHNASLMGLVSSPGLAAYCASKAGLVSLTRSMALDCARDNVRVNCICPGIIHTPMLERRFALQLDRDAAYRATAARPPVQYLGRPEDVAAGIAYLASSEARFVTGSALTIDGGVGAA
jgi:meso-butanediol dehydrogenase/(S,S)-butanediol dehydrogenase/diacetyl reductase